MDTPVLLLPPRKLLSQIRVGCQGYGNFATPRNIASIIFNQKAVIDDCVDDYWPDGTIFMLRNIRMYPGSFKFPFSSWQSWP